MSTMQVKSYSAAIGIQAWRSPGPVLGVAFRRIAAVLALWRKRAAARRRPLAPRHIDDCLLADIGLTRIDLKLPIREFIFWW